MKKTEIDSYVSMDGSVVITGFRNIATAEEIKNELGKEGLRLYRQGTSYFFDTGDIILFEQDSESKNVWQKARINKGHTTKEWFEIYINLMRDAGKRLSEIRGFLKGAKANQATTII